MASVPSTTWTGYSFVRGAGRPEPPTCERQRAWGMRTPSYSNTFTAGRGMIWARASPCARAARAAEARAGPPSPSSGAVTRAEQPALPDMTL
jgi:hypothetical protein